MPASSGEAAASARRTHYTEHCEGPQQGKHYYGRTLANALQEIVELCEKYVDRKRLVCYPTDNGKISIRGWRTRSGNRQISQVAHVGRGKFSSTSRSMALAYCLPLLTLMNRIDVMFQAMRSAGPLEPAARQTSKPAASSKARALCSARRPLCAVFIHEPVQRRNAAVPLSAPRVASGARHKLVRPYGVSTARS